MMKNFSICFVLFLLFANLSTFAQEKAVSESDLPFIIREYVAIHFKNNKIEKCEEEKKGNYVTYKIKLNDIKLEFDHMNKIKEISSKSDSILPDNVIPPSILSYVKSHYAGSGIMEWELKKKKQEVKLKNGLELEFGLDGKFLRIDD